MVSSQSASGQVCDPAQDRRSSQPSLLRDEPPLLEDSDVEEFIRDLQERLRQNERDLFGSTADDVGSSACDEESQAGPQQSERDAESYAAGRLSLRYDVLQGIAVGGMGTIYRAYDRQLDREVALKVLSSGRDAPALLQRFVTEARVLAQLQHPGIPPVYEEGWLPDGRAFIAMKLVQGHTLSEQLKARSAPKADLVKFLGVFRQVCETVAFAHSQGVLHRDLKPDNVMVGPFGEVQVIDWGLAKRLGAPNADSTVPGEDSQPTESSANGEDSNGSDVCQVTIAGGPLGTPAYMPPEQALGTRDQICEASDVFSLGAILCEILTGRPPFRDWGVKEVREACHATALLQVHEQLAGSQADDVLKKLAIHCLQPDPAGRPQSAAEIVELLDAHLDSLQDRLWEMELAHTKEQEYRRRRRLTTALILCASLFIAIVSGGWTVWSRQQTARRQEATEVVVEALGEARQLREAALAHPLKDEQFWLGADEAIRRAEAVAAQAKDPETLHRLARLAALIRTESDLAEKDRTFIAQIVAATNPVSINEVREHSPNQPMMPPPGMMDRAPGEHSGHGPPPHHRGGPHEGGPYEGGPHEGGPHDGGPPPAHRHRRPHHGPPPHHRGGANGHRRPPHLREGGDGDGPPPHHRVGPDGHGPPPHHSFHPPHLDDGFHPPGAGFGPRRRHQPRELAVKGRIIHERYLAALVAYGIDPETTSAADAAARLLSRPDAVRQQTIDGLHRWLGLTTIGPRDPDQTIDWLLTLLAAIDADPQRSRIRQLIGEEDYDTLESLAQEPDLLDHPPTFVWLAAMQLFDPHESQALILKARNRYPGSLVLNQQLADNHVRLGEDEQAVDAFMAVLAIHENAHTYVRTALSLDHGGHADEAIAMCRNAIRIAPLKSDGYPVLARTLYHNDRCEEAVEVIRTARPQFPRDATAWHMLSMVLAGSQRKLGRTEAARRTYQEIADNEAVPDGVKSHVRHLIDSLKPESDEPATAP